jgi:hypothetical protein
VRFLFCLPALIVSLAAFGCGGDKRSPDVKRVKVSGSVKLDGKPLQAGYITFDPQNGQPPAAITILDGKYDDLAPIGKCKVSITSSKKTTMREITKMDGPGYDEVMEINLLPERYNLKSEITKEITAEGPNTFDFNDLQSK